MPFCKTKGDTLTPLLIKTLSTVSYPGPIGKCVITPFTNISRPNKRNLGVEGLCDCECLGVDGGQDRVVGTEEGRSGPTEGLNTPSECEEWEPCFLAFQSSFI